MFNRVETYSPIGRGLKKRICVLKASPHESGVLRISGILVKQTQSEDYCTVSGGVAAVLTPIQRSIPSFSSGFCNLLSNRNVASTGMNKNTGLITGWPSQVIV
ncbi:hypothetical protein RB195_000702 [Necator americanus]|uniref:Uncharacterized protein n=1 Tax=Necator americanus TaxID=51031 RepID=A0ABR1DCN6_NECAM